MKRRQDYHESDATLPAHEVVGRDFTCTYSRWRLPSLTHHIFLHLHHPTAIPAIPMPHNLSHQNSYYRPDPASPSIASEPTRPHLNEASPPSKSSPLNLSLFQANTQHAAHPPHGPRNLSSTRGLLQCPSYAPACPPPCLKSSSLTARSHMSITGIGASDCAPWSLSGAGKGSVGRMGFRNLTLSICRFIEVSRV